MSEDLSPSSYLNASERKLLGPVVQRLCATGNARFQRALEESGPKATARMACVNALRIYAIGLFALGVIARFGGVPAVALAFYVLAVGAMGWSFWCLYTVVGPEREFKRGLEQDGEDARQPAREALDALLRKLGREGSADDRAV